MLKIKEMRGSIFSVTLSDNSVLTLQAGESQNIKDELMSDSLRSAEYLGIVTIKTIPKSTGSNTPKKEKVEV